MTSGPGGSDAARWPRVTSRYLRPAGRGILDYRHCLGLDTALIHHLASLVRRFRQAMERVQA